MVLKGAAAYLGCWVDSDTERDLPHHQDMGSTATIAECIQICFNESEFLSVFPNTLDQ